MPTSLALWLIAMLQAASSNGVPAAGVPLTLAQSRAGRMSDLRYDLHFTIPAAATEPLAGRSTIRFELRAASAPLALDFSEPAQRISSLSVNGRAIEPRVAEGHVVLPAADLRAGSNEVRLAFLAGDASLNRNPDFLYTLFVPARAHLAFPCFDQPDLKARWTLALDVPSGWQVLANGAETAREESAGIVTVRFAETPAAAHLPVRVRRRQVLGRDRRTRQDARSGCSTAKPTPRKSRGTATPFSISTPHRWPGSSGTRASRIRGASSTSCWCPRSSSAAWSTPARSSTTRRASCSIESATQNQKLGRASVIAHETAHMWFGDLVTMRWFDDVWMKEVFANFMAAKIVNPSFPEINHELRFLYAHYPAAYDVDRTPGTNAIRQPLDNLNEAGSLYGAIIYQKAPIVMRQLEGILGEESFRDGLREYLRDARVRQRHVVRSDCAARSAHARGPGGLEPCLGRRGGTPQRSPPSFRSSGGRITPSCVRAARSRVRARIELESAAAGHRLVVSEHTRVARPAVVGRYGSAGRYRAAGSRLRAADRAAASATGISRSTTPASRICSATFPKSTDPLTRGAAWVTLWEQMLDGRVAPAAVMALALRALPLEGDELNVARILGYSVQTYWMFLDAPARDATSPSLERLLRAGLDHATTASLKSAWFSALRDTARSRARRRVARADLEKNGSGARPSARRARLHRTGAGARRPRGTGVEGNPRRAIDPHRESRPQGPLRIREAGALTRSVDA